MTRHRIARVWRTWRRPPDLSVPMGAVDVESANRRFLMYGVLPLTALAFLGTLHADQVRRLLRGARDADDWKLLPKSSPLPARYLAGFGIGVGLCVALPYAEEMFRCLKAARRHA
ncbi:hypothetical protein [Streptomyces sp. NPDC059008]|uniref:hypothetical protein n=1 Tax=Streptomyces sp. NPDC059008 TaxID=3346693 RepID=UPI0036BF0A0E